MYFSFECCGTAADACALVLVIGPLLPRNASHGRAYSTRICSASKPCNHEDSVLMTRQKLASTHARTLAAHAGLVARQPRACKGAENPAEIKSKFQKKRKEGALTEEVSHQLRASFQSNSFQRARHDRQIHVNGDKNAFPQIPAAQFELSAACAHARSKPGAPLMTSRT